MFERFTERAREVVRLAEKVTVADEREWIDTRDLLIALIREGEGLAASVLANLGVTEGAVRGRPPYPWRSERGPKKKEGESTPFSVATKRALELALREALSLGHNYIGTEHILLGLMRGGGDSVAALARFWGTSQDDAASRVREEVLRVFRPSAPKRPPLPETSAETHQFNLLQIIPCYAVSWGRSEAELGTPLHVTQDDLQAVLRSIIQTNPKSWVSIRPNPFNETVVANQSVTT